MKKISRIIISIFLMICIAACAISLVVSYKTMEPKLVNTDEFRIISANSLSDSEKSLLDCNLKLNKNVLLLYYETEKDIDPTTEKMIVGNYSKQRIPYVIYVYNPVEKTLKTISSDKTYLDFEDFCIEDVSYTEIYRHISGIKSKLMISQFSQDGGFTIILIIVILYLIVIIFIMLSEFLLRLKYCIRWNKGQKGILYKESFFENSYKIRIDPDSKNVVRIYANVPLKNEKGYSYYNIPKKDKSGKDLNKIVIVFKYYTAEFKASQNYLLGFSYEASVDEVPEGDDCLKL
mgnify:CR=1 FL=1